MARRARASECAATALSILSLAGLASCSSCDGEERPQGTPQHPADPESRAPRRYQAPDDSWHEETLAWDRSPVDLRFLNEADKPAGSHGPLRVDGERLVFDDGTEARLWGTNLQAYALFQTDKDTARRQARRIAAFGYNLVRFHHHDSFWVKPNIFDLSSGTTQQLSDRALDALDWWIHCLAEEGVYVWLDLNVGRVFEPGDEVPGSEEQQAHNRGRGFALVNPRMEALMQRFARDYLSHDNRYRGHRYMDDPAVAAVLIANENDITNHFSNAMLPEKGNPRHTAMLHRQLERFTSTHSLAEIEPREVRDLGAPRLALAAVEGAFYERAISDLRSFGLQRPIVTTSYWGHPTPSALLSAALGDMVDAHSYGSEGYLEVNPHEAPGYLDWVAAGHVAGKPLSISEWAVEADRRDRFVTTLHFAAVASLQGWDMPLHFTYQQRPFGPPPRATKGNNSYDPAIMAMMPAAAVLFREHHVRTARKGYLLRLTEADLFERRTQPSTRKALRTLTEQSQVTVSLPQIEELPFTRALSQLDAGEREVVDDLDRDFLAGHKRRVSSDTGELMRDFVDGYYTIDTAKTQAAAGWVGGRSLRLENVVLELSTDSAAVALTSLDGLPLARSQKILLTTAAQAVPGPGKRMPYRVQPVVGKLTLVGMNTPRQLLPLRPDGTRLPARSPDPAASDAGQVFSLPDDLPTHWSLLVPRNP